MNAPLLVILGETASGKSSLALELAQRLNGEIICADSWAVYKDFDIGTAKPSAKEQQLVPHHLIDVADAAKGFNAVLFQRLAKRAIVEIGKRGKLAILAGGTGLYIDSVIYDFSFLPASDANMRNELNHMSLPEILKRAEDMGLDTSIIDNRNKRRVIRLIENNGKLPTKRGLRDDTLLLGLAVRREELLQRATARVNQMLKAGLEDEVRRLVDRYGWDVEPMRGIGYKEFKKYLSGHQSLTVTEQQIIKNTMDLAKRQRTWFKRNNSIHWINDRSKITDIVDFVTANLNK